MATNLVLILFKQTRINEYTEEDIYITVWIYIKLVGNTGKLKANTIQNVNKNNGKEKYVRCTFKKYGK